MVNLLKDARLLDDGFSHDDIVEFIQNQRSGLTEDRYPLVVKRGAIDDDGVGQWHERA